MRELPVSGDNSNVELLVSPQKSTFLLCPATKSGGVLCYTLRTFECLSIRPSANIRVRSINLIPFEIISRNLVQI